MRPMRSGRARISAKRPRAMAECDRCGHWHNLDDLRHQMQWSGNTLIDTGLLVGADCLDVPQQQFRSPILPADPYPRINPRPSPNVTPVPAAVGQPLPTTPDNQGFSVYQLGLVLMAAPVTPPSPPSSSPSLDFSQARNSMYLGLI